MLPIAQIRSICARELDAPVDYNFFHTQYLAGEASDVALARLFRSERLRNASDVGTVISMCDATKVGPAFDLQDELDSRLAPLRETEDNVDVHELELVRTALDDICELSAEDHGACNKTEVEAWKAVQRLAKRRLGMLRRQMNELTVDRRGDVVTVYLCTDCEAEGGLEDTDLVKSAKRVPASCDRCDWREPPT